MMVLVVKTFMAQGEEVRSGTLLDIDDSLLPKLDGLVKVLTPGEAELMARSSDWREFCDSHERTMADGHCRVKHDRMDPMTHCVGWQLKMKRTIH